MIVRRATVRAVSFVCCVTFFAAGISKAAEPSTSGDIIASASRGEKHYSAAPANFGQYLERLVSAYPESVDHFDAKYLYLRNGLSLPISDNQSNKTFEQLLSHPDLDDMFYARYPNGESPSQPELNFDPGRVRYTPFFKAMYGDCSHGEVVKHLRTIKWLPRHGGGAVQITRVNGVDRALERVSADLDRLPVALIAFTVPTAGAFNCRSVAGTENTSMHAYGAAIDLNVNCANYWRWDRNPKKPKWKNKIPAEVVSIFERHGFIWGGRWYHYDTMHFEYRPELLN